MISNSGYDENHKYSGGQAGDQTGLEWRLLSWYSYPWNCVLRYPDPAVRAKIAENSIAAAKNDNIGYDMGQRVTYWGELEKVDYDPAKITTPCEADCSAGVCANVKAAGYQLGLPKLQAIVLTSTHYMRSLFQAAGFQVLTDAKYLTSDKYLLAGDILLNDAHHVAVNVTDGALSGGEAFSWTAENGASAAVSVGTSGASVAAATATAPATTGTSGTSPVTMGTQDVLYFSAPQTYQNGSTDEIVYADTARKLKIGSLNPWEKCECLGIVDGMYIVRYQVDGTTNHKVGVVVYDGRVK